MENHDTPEIDVTMWKAIGLAVLYLVNYIVHNYNSIMGNIFITLSVVFLGYKMYKEYQKDKKNG